MKNFDGLKLASVLLSVGSLLCGFLGTIVDSKRADKINAEEWANTKNSMRTEIQKEVAIEVAKAIAETNEIES